MHSNIYFSMLPFLLYDFFPFIGGMGTNRRIQTPEGQTDPRVIVESEDQPDRILLETKIQREDGFQKQQGTKLSLTRIWQVVKLML